jgi:ADP-ribosylglycohydrolase
MLGAIAGDIIGSAYEGRPVKTKDFVLFGLRSTFTDDTVLTVACAHAILENKNYGTSFKKFGRRYPHAGYGDTFFSWLFSDDLSPYNSWGNGSAMRVSPVGFACNSVESVLEEAGRSASVTHNHPEGIKGAQATALAVYLARTGTDKEQIKSEIAGRFDYDLDRTLDTIRPRYYFDVSCQGSVPESIIAFLESTDYEDAVRNAVSLGGDSDTMACIAGAVAQAFYGEISPEIIGNVRKRLPSELLDIVDRFNATYNVAG